MPIRVILISDNNQSLVEYKKQLKPAEYELKYLNIIDADLFRLILESDPDIILIELIPSREPLCFDISDRLNNTCHIPFVYIADHYDELVFAESQLTKPYGFLIKPFRENGLYALITTVINCYSRESGLRKFQDSLVNFIESQNDVLLGLNASGNLIYIGRHIESLLGYRSSDILNTPFTKYLSERDAYYMSDYLNSKTREHIKLILELMDFNGNTVWAQAALYPVFKEDIFSGVRIILRNITEFRQTQEKLNKERNYYKNLIEILPFRFFLKDINSKYISCNSAFASEFNITPDEIPGKSDFDLYPGELAEKIKESDRMILEERDNISYIDRVGKGGKDCWIYRFKKRVADENNENAGIVGFYWDITEKKQLEEELDRSRAILAKAQEMASIGSFEYNIESGELNISDEMRRLYGLSPAGISGREFLAKIITSDISELIEKVSAGRLEDINLEYDLEVNVQEEKKIFHITTEIINNDNGIPVKIIGTSQDITKQKQSEEMLRENQARLQLSLDAAGAGTWISDLSSGLVSWDRRMQDMFGFNSNVFPSDESSWKKNIHPEDALYLEASIKRAIKTGERFEITSRAVKNGNVNYIYSQVDVLKDKNGRSSKLVGICTDITDRILAKKRDLEINEELERKVNERTRELRDALLELENKQAALIVSEEQFRNAFIFAMHGMAQISIGGRILNANPALCRLLGYEERELIDIDFNGIIQNEDYAGNDIFESLISGSSQSFNRELRLGRKDGQLIWVSLGASIVRDAYERPLRIICQIVDLEERRKAEQAVKISEKRFIMAANLSGAGVIEYTLPDYSGIYFSERWANILGYSCGTLPSCDNPVEWFFSCIHADDVSFVERVNMELVEGSVETYNIEFKVKHRTGKWITVQCLSRAVERDENNRAKRLIKIVSDISDRKRMEDALTFLVKLNEILFDSGVEEIMQLGLDKCESLTESSIGYFHFVNADQETITLKTWSNNTKTLCKISEKASHYPISEAGVWADCIREKKPVIHNDYSAILAKKGLPHGHVPVTRDLAVPVFSKNNIAAVVGVGNKPEDYNERDIYLLSVIAENTWSAIARKRALEALEESEERYRKLMESMSDFTYSAKLFEDGSVETEYISGDLFSATGYTAEELNAFSDGYQHIVDKEDIKAVSDIMPVLLSNKSAAVEYRIYNKNGAARWFRDYIRPVYDDKEKRVTHLIGGIQDITDKKKVEEKLIEAKREAERDSVSKSAFLANISHEIRTPLNAVIGLSELLRASVTDKKQQSYLMTINTAGKSLLTLINDILDLSKIEVGIMELNPVPVNLLRFLEEIESIFKIKVLEKSIDFKIITDEELPAILMLDESRLRQVMLNIVGNAIKFTGKGNVVVKVEKEAMHEGGNRIDLMIAVEDTGIGIKREDMKSIFEAFKQSENIGREFGGTGLGLSISKRLVEMMNGEIHVMSIPGAGSIFIIMLYDVVVGTLDYLNESRKKTDLERIRFNSERVLIVDDIESNRVMLREVLERVNLVGIEADSGEECIRLANEYKPDLIITDIRMPGMDGYELINRLKKGPATGDIPVMAITASAKPEDKEKILRCGFDSYLAKPVDIAKLFNELSGFFKFIKIGGEESVLKLDDMLSGGEITDIRNLVDVLKNKIIPGMKNAKGVIRVKYIREIAEQIEKLAGDHNVSALKIYSERLNDAAKSYDIDTINKRLSEFNSIVEKLEEKADYHEAH
ncbi:MAG: PAS domain S-box protein [Spirochaetes bacterium]|nr:PAS domain S-box protein [Spirochaetota bacterium]